MKTHRNGTIGCRLGGPKRAAWRLGLVAGCLVLGAALGGLALATDPKPEAPGKGKGNPAPEAVAGDTGGAAASGAGGVAGGAPPQWEHYVGRLREVTQEQSRIRVQEEILRRRVEQPGALGERVQERLAARLHELDAQDRQVRRQKQEILAEIGSLADALKTELEDAQADLITRQAAETREDRRKQLEGRLREVETLLSRLPDIQKNPDRFVDFNPQRRREEGREPGDRPYSSDSTASRSDNPPDSLDGPEAPDAPTAPDAPDGPSGFLPERFALRRLHQIEEQIRFMRSRLDELERELDQLKRAGIRGEGLEGAGSEGGKQGRRSGPDHMEPPFPAPGQGFGPGQGLDRGRRGERPFPGGPRRDPVPPAGFAPGSEPGLVPQEGDREPLSSPGASFLQPGVSQQGLPSSDPQSQSGGEPKKTP